jgi:hypothetical protein
MSNLSQSASGESGSDEGPTALVETVPASDPGEVGKALQNASPDDDLTTAAEEGTISAGEAGRAVAVDDSSGKSSDVEVVIEKTPDAHDITLMHWAARCSDGAHDLLGYFDSEQEARQAKEDHLAAQH